LVFEIQRGAIADNTLSAEDFGVGAATVDDLKGGDVKANAKIAHQILAGKKGPKRDIVLVNASAALVAAGKAANFLDGVKLAKKSIDSGAAAAKLEALVQFTQQALTTI
jgi:anthranilate phosphoribosyltransferase